MSLPKSVVAQGERAEALLQKVASRGNTEQPAPAQAPATPAPVASPEAPKETPAPAAQPAALSEAEQSLRVLKGKYNAEVPRLAAEKKAAEERATKAEAELAEARKKAAALPLVTPDDIKEFGEPLVEMARKIAREENRSVIDENLKLQATVEELRAQVKGTAQVGQRLNTQSFLAALDAKHADWRAINEDQEFLKWLDGIDPLYGKPRQAILDEAQDALDADRVAAFFAAYKADVQSRAAPRNAALESQVTPSTTPGAPALPDAGKKIWTPALIAKFYDDLRRGRFTAQEAERIELDLQAAPREGRYRAK